MIGRVALAAAAAALLLPAAAQAQARQCAVPAELPRPHADLPSASQPRRLLPIRRYTLALSWGPQQCRTRSGERQSAFQCGIGNRFGWTLHGLWPDGEGATWPQYCRATELLSEPVVRGNLCATPSVQLLQHEWAKHGTCTGETPAAYFDAATALYRRIRYPDMDRLSRRRLTVGGFARSFAAANRGLSADMLRVTATRDGWLDEVWVCMGRQRRYERCPADAGGAPAEAALKIWRGRG